MTPANRRLATLPLVVPLVLLLAGCMSTGIVTIDRDICLVHKKSAQPLFGSADGVVVDLYREAGDFCRLQNLAVETVDLNKERTILLSPGGATLKFRCVAPASGS